MRDATLHLQTLRPTGLLAPWLSAADEPRTTAPDRVGAAARSEAVREVVLLAGGKTGGHIFPALAVAEELESRGWGSAFLGTEEGMERRLAADRGMKFRSVDAAPLLGRGLVHKILALARTLASSFRARRIVRQEGGSVLIGTGGFVSAPGVVGARLAGVPILLLEPNASAGVANRWLSRVASGAALAHPQTGAEFHCPSTVTGVPVRSAFFAQGPRPADAHELRVLVLGGSQGARELNRQLPGLLAAAAETAVRPVRVVHQTGASGLDAASEHYGEWTEDGPSRFSAQNIRVELAPFIEDMPNAIGSADLIVSRAGAVTLAEICAVGRGSVLIPLPIAAGHQGDNARALCGAGAATMIEEKELGDESTLDEFRRMFAEPGRLQEMAQAAAALAHKNAARDIADRVQDLARGVGEWR